MMLFLMLEWMFPAQLIYTPETGFLKVRTVPKVRTEILDLNYLA